MTNPNDGAYVLIKCAECGKPREDCEAVFPETPCEDGDCGHPRGAHGLTIYGCTFDGTRDGCPCTGYVRHKFVDGER